jgi:dTDP-4-amino-4,6-dideoxygalactose transaminase
MDKIIELSKKYNFGILEDCSQSHETRYKGNHLGSYGDMAVYSLYPGKNLGAAGDAGIITTNSEELNKRLRSIRNYGSSVKYHYDEIGHNHRLDSIQAIVLSEKLKHLHSWTITKNQIVSRFLSEMNNDKVILPKKSDDCTLHSYHIFCVRVEDRIAFEKHMASNGVTTIIHYPIPIHKTKIFDSSMDIVYSSKITDEWADKIVSLPIHPFLTTEEVDLIINSVNNF